MKTLLNFTVLCAALSSAVGFADEPAQILRSEGPLAAAKAASSINLLGTEFEVAGNAVVLIDDQIVGYGSGALANLPHDGTVQVSAYSLGMTTPVSTIRVSRNARYIAGATTVTLHDTVRWVRPSIALMKVGQTVVDYSQILASDPELIPKVGEETNVIGTWPSANAPILAQSVIMGVAHSAAKPTSIGISGSGISKGISGSGLTALGISGSGVISTGISGSGVKASQRPQVSLGISGSSVLSKGISGSGVISTGISGSGVKATSRPAVSLGISGSGAISTGISGSGIMSKGISGSGVISTGISGSGAKSALHPISNLGISGSGAISTGISGSGVTSKGISGSGHN